MENNEASPPPGTRAGRSHSGLFRLGLWALLLVGAGALFAGWRPWHGWPPKDSPPGFGPTGPSVIQLERLDALVSTRVNVATGLKGQSKWLEGSWNLQGDALRAVDLTRAELVERDPKARTAVFLLPKPGVLSPRVDHEKTQRWSIESRSWIPFSGTFLGNQKKMEEEAMKAAQDQIAEAAATPECDEIACRTIEEAIRTFYEPLGWHVTVRWK